MLKDTNLKRSLNFNLVNCDTDAIMINKLDKKPFSKEERSELLSEINSLLPPRIKFEDNGFFHKVICFAAKNYVLLDENNKTKLKGSSLKDPKKELALQEFIKEIINTILVEKYDYINIYNKYVIEIKGKLDINRWVTKKTITSKVLQGTRTNETKIMDAIEGSEYSEGDKVQVYFDNSDALKLVENYNNDHNIDKLLAKLYKVTKTFDEVITKGTFINYSLKKNKDTLLKISN